MMKLIYGIEGYANMFKRSPQKNKQPNIYFLKYIKGIKYREAEVGKYVYAVREGKSIEGRQYVRIQLSVAHDVIWDNWYTTHKGHYMKKVEKQPKPYKSDCVDPLWFLWLVRSTRKTVLTDDLCEVNKRRSRIPLGMNYKRCADNREQSEDLKTEECDSMQNDH